jgi:hypothetical protein
MTAQDIDLKQFSVEDLNYLRETITKQTKPAAARVCIFVDSRAEIPFNYDNILG